ncbi:hypothetical protein VP01_613g2, partial [Puccinia sorghi]
FSVTCSVYLNESLIQRIFFIKQSSEEESVPSSNMVNRYDSLTPRTMWPQTTSSLKSTKLYMAQGTSSFFFLPSQNAIMKSHQGAVHCNSFLAVCQSLGPITRLFREAFCGFWRGSLEASLCVEPMNKIYWIDYVCYYEDLRRFSPKHYWCYFCVLKAFKGKATAYVKTQSEGNMHTLPCYVQRVPFVPNEAMCTCCLCFFPGVRAGGGFSYINGTRSTLNLLTISSLRGMRTFYTGQMFYTIIVSCKLIYKKYDTDSGSQLYKQHTRTCTSLTKQRLLKNYSSNNIFLPLRNKG